MKLTSPLGIFFLFFLVPGIAQGWQTKNEDLPNIVIILADDMGFGDVRALNPKSKIATPNLDRLHEEGCTFLDAHSPSSVCTPTRYSLLTGRYSWRTPMKRGVLQGYSKPMLEPDRVTIASKLKAAGYQTGIVGKWHLGMEMPMKQNDADVPQFKGDPGIDFAGQISDSPIHHGFDYYFGVSASLDMAPYVYIRNDRFTALPTVQQPAVKFPHFVRRGPRAEDFVIDECLDRLVDEATTFIRDKSADDESPYFLYVPFTAPHKPTQPNDKFRGTTELGPYGDFIAQVDDAVGQILSAVRAGSAGNNRKTMLVFTSDNGSYMHRYDQPRKDHVDDTNVQGFRAENHQANGPWRGTKADIYEAGHRVPFFVYWPGTVPAGSVARETVCHVDLFATCAEIIGQPLTDDEAEDSFSILKMAEGDKTATRPVPVIHQAVSGMLAIRDGDWKMIAGNGSGGREKPAGKMDEGPFMLFNLQTDPGETNDLAEQHPDVLKKLTDKLAKIRHHEKGSRFVQ